MRKIYLFFFISLSCLIFSCEEEIEPASFDPQYEFQPLEIGRFWIYEVEQTIHFGENDSEEFSFFVQDRIRSSYANVEGNLVYVVQRSTSEDQSEWVKELDYTIQIKDLSLLRTVNNQTLVALSFPPEVGKVWNGLAYRAEGSDEFEVETMDSEQVKVKQEELDDEVTIRDLRYEVFQKEVGLIEKYSEVVTYCSRNDCLGQQLINGGEKIHLRLVDYGKN
ncbi:hypothetical protein Aoki45_06730 [Algoriphagus sp. oki45]|uniref:hypothetical protein n=1 Tax=Algoriphagus sp. oki45 TaxID=3067294 RepID=UPI0027E87AC5|nr:hypothetical protein Aoki45_06730 [Algoriphagus sp. oki45]